MEESVRVLKAGGQVENLTLENAERAIAGLKQAIANKRCFLA